MANINPTNTLRFISSQELLATIRVDLESYDAMGVLNNQKYYRHIKHILNRLGLSVYEEYNGITDIESYVGILPENFSILYAAFRVKPNSNNFQNKINLGKTTYWIEETVSSVEKGCNFAIPSIIKPESKIEYQVKVSADQINTLEWNTPQLMKLSTRTPNDIYTKDCINVGNGSANEFAIDTKLNKVYTNFQNDSILLQYYGLPVDEYGLPKVPDDPIYYDAIYTYIRFKIFEDLFYNNNVQDIQTKYQKAEIDHNKAFKEATYRSKLFSFQEAVQAVNTSRNRFSQYQLN